MQRIEDFMTMFQSGNLIGIDIGLSSVKMCELSGSKGRYTIEGFSIISLSEAAIIEDEIQKPEEIVGAIEMCYQRLQSKKKIVSLGIDGPNTMTKRMNVPDGSKDDIENNVLWEAEQFIPFGADESEMDYHIIGELADEEDILDVLVVAAKIPVIEDFQNLVKLSGLNVKIVDLKSLALINSFSEAYRSDIDKHNDGVAIIDFGAQKTTIIVYKEGAPALSKEINFGGVLVTEEIQRQLGLSYAEAEEIKISGAADGQHPEDVVNIIRSHNEDMLQEIKKVLNFYISPGAQEQIYHVFITGGSSMLPNLKEDLADILELKVSRMKYTHQFNLSKFAAKNKDIIDLVGGVALGLGMRKI
jgi:type IV pilus assembly protein PilM